MLISLGAETYENRVLIVSSPKSKPPIDVQQMTIGGNNSHAFKMDPLIDELRLAFDTDDVIIEDVEKILQSYKSNRRDWQKYAHFDERNYTRNLVDTGNGRYNLILLCWGPGMCTNIHDHSGAHCFVKMLDGDLLETRFAFPTENSKIGPLSKTDEVRVGLNDVTYMSDQLGLHRMENPSHCEPAVSLHIYSPPYESCHLFDQRTSQKHVSQVTFWSKFGKMQGKELPFDTISSSTRKG